MRLLLITFLLLITIGGWLIYFQKSVPVDQIREDAHVPENNADRNEMKAVQEEQSDEDPIVAMIESMSLQEKLGQMFVVGIEGTTMDEMTEQLIEQYHIGGIILFKRNILQADQTRRLLNQLKERNSHNKIPLFLGIDEEGGRVSRLPEEFLRLPSLRELAMSQNEENIYQIGRLQAKRIQSLGFNLNFAPVLDIHSNPQNEVIGDRSFGTNPEIVTRLGIKMMNGIASEGVVPVIKHFPGHGDTLVDSHVDLPVLKYPFSRLEKIELVPFIEAVKQGAELIMVAHILIPSLDREQPASLSEVIIGTLLRQEIGFDGVVITDDLVMGAITKEYGIGEAAVQAIVAGNDLVLVGHEYEHIFSAIHALQKAVDEGVLTEERIDESLYRILTLKYHYELRDTSREAFDVQQLNQQLHSILN